MKNTTLVKDYYSRSLIRNEALQVLFEKGGFADVVREAQEIVELLSKSAIRFLGAEPARVHDVSAQLDELRERVPKKLHGDIDELIIISKDLRRDRELAFYGTEDLTPSEFYSKSDAKKALGQAKRAIEIVEEIIREGL